MDKRKAKKLEEKGWKVGSAASFLGLSQAEEAFVEMKLALAGSLRDYRATHSLTQAQAARVVGSSQSRVAKMESADPSVSLDLMVRSLLSLGATPAFLARVISGAYVVGEQPAAYRSRRELTLSRDKPRPRKAPRTKTSSL